jgi:exodeoxyribonuclease VII small subunit
VRSESPYDLRVAAKPSVNADVSDLSYEQARAELTQVVQKLETGGATLEESLALWERGEALADACQAWLDGARKKLEAARAAREQS